MGMGMLDWNDVLHGSGKADLERDALPAYLPRCRWFGSKGRAIAGVEIRDAAQAPDGAEWALLFLRVRFAEGDPEEYLLPLARLEGPAASDLFWETPRAIVTATAAYAESGARLGAFTILCEAVYLESFRVCMMDLIARDGSLPGLHGSLRGHANPSASITFSFTAEAAPAPLVPAALPGDAGHVVAPDAPVTSMVLKAEQSNTSVIFPGRYFVKFLRRLETGENPESEVLRFLHQRTGFRNAPGFIGSLEYTPGPGPAAQGNTSVTARSASYTVAIAQGLVAHESVAWNHALALAGAYLESLAGHRGSPSPEAGTPSNPMAEIRSDDPARGFARLLGRRTAEMHLALASRPDLPDFAPEPFTLIFQRSLHAGIAGQVEDVYALLARALPRLPESTAALGRRIQASRPQVMSAFGGLLERLIPTVKTRVHGDYHLGQVLFTGKDVVILDFEGEPARSLPERKLKRSPWKDVAGMLRSFHYAAHSAWAAAASGLEADAKTAMEPWVEGWPDRMCTAFLESYAQAAGDAAFVPGEEDRQGLLRVHLMEKAVYELGYELNNRPDWAHIPMLGILRLL